MILATGNCVMRQKRTIIHILRKRIAQGAITFIELLLVIIIIGVLAGISLPRFRSNFDRLQLNNASLQMQSLMNYLRERAIIDAKVVYLNIDNEQREYWGYVLGQEKRLKTYHIPSGINIEATQYKVSFYPDGTIDRVTINIAGRDAQAISLTTEGVFGGVKLQAQQ